MQIKTKFITDGAVTNAKLATASDNTVKGNKSGGVASPTDLALSDVAEDTSSVLTITHGTKAIIGSSNLTIQVKQAGTSQAGYLSATDWNTFNGKQSAGNYITALTGDATASGPGSAALTFATVNSNVGSFGSASSVATFTVNAKGLVTAAGSTSIQIAESQVTGLVSDLAGKQATGSYITALTSDVTASGPGSATATIANSAVTNAKMANMNSRTVKANLGSSAAAPSDVALKLLGWDAVVGSGGTHADLNAVMADSNIATISRILVADASALTSTQIISQSDVEIWFRRLAVYSKSSATKGISINADRVTIRGGRFSGFNGGGDVAIQVETGKKNCLIEGSMFNTNTTSINDLGTNTTIANNIEEQ